MPGESIGPQLSAIARAIVAYYRRHRRELPWRQTRDPYAIWISEVMCQQTRVATAVPYWQRWMARFPTVADLAVAPLDDVTAMWAGLGYYARARNLHGGAGEVVAKWGGQLPRTVEALRQIRGIGPYTAGAIASIAFAQRTPIVDGNVARVFARLWAMTEDIKSSTGQIALWNRARALVEALPARCDPGELNQGLMEVGALVCTPARPTCGECPLADWCSAARSGTQATYPIRRGRKAVHELPELRVQAAWWQARGKVLLGRRAGEGLYGGLWELPSAPKLPALIETLVGSPVQLTRAVLRHSQVLSHRRLRIDVYPITAPARVLRRQSQHGYDELSWYTLGEAAGLGVSSATRSILDRLGGKEFVWSPTRKPSSSSKRDTRRSLKASPASATPPVTRTSRRPHNVRQRGSMSLSTIKRK